MYITKAAPAIKATWYFLVNFVGPLYLQLWKLCMWSYETLPIELIEALMGLSMCFCGGAYCASIAAVEAFRMTGWDTTRRALRDVYTDAKPIIAAWKADNKKDDDKDGSPDVQQLAPAELLKRKAQVTAVAVKDPDKLLAACGGLYTSWLAVQGTLRLQFAKTITLGVSIANELDKPIARVAVPILVGVMPPRYHHWIPALQRTASKMVAVAIAWQLQVVISAVQSAVRGGCLAARKLLAYGAKHGLIQYKESDRYDELFGYTLALFGFCTQWQWGFALPFPLNLVMLPFTIIEWYVRWAVTGS